MSNVHYHPSRLAVSSEIYVRGKNDDRAVAITCDVPGGPGAWSTRASTLAKHNSRKVEALHYRQSFSSEEFDPHEAEDMQRVNDLGYQLAKRMHPESDVLVVTHIDGKGGQPHNHILVINHDNQTGKALSNYRTFLDRPEQGQQKGVRSANDKLMRENGLAVTPIRRQAPTDWELRREDFANRSLDREMGDRFQSALNDRRSVDKAGLVSVIDEQNAWIERWNTGSGHELLPTMRLHGAVSRRTDTEVWTLYIQDLRCSTGRSERRKRVTQLSADFTPEGAQPFFDHHQNKREDQHVLSTRQVESTTGQGPGGIEEQQGGSIALAAARIALARRRDEQEARPDRVDTRRAGGSPHYEEQHGLDRHASVRQGADGVSGSDDAEPGGRQRSRQFAK